MSLPRLPVWTGRPPEPCGCVGLVDGEWGCTETARFLLGEDPYCADCMGRELTDALTASKILGACRNEPQGALAL